MKLTPENTKDKDVKVFDSSGRQIKGVIEFDTESFIAKMIILGSFAEDKTGPFPLVVKNEVSDTPANNLLIIEVKLPGCFATIDGQRI